MATTNEMQMEVINESPSATQEEVAIAAPVITENAEATKPNNQQQQVTKVNLLYEQCLGFIPGSLRGKRDPRYVYAKFDKTYKGFDFTHEEILQTLEEVNLLQYLQLLQISKPNKSIDIRFRTEDAAEFFIQKHIEIRGKPIPFIRKAKRVLRVTIRGIHPDVTDDEVRADLIDYAEHVTSIRHTDRHYKGVVFYDGSRQVFVTHLTQHIPRSIKIGNRWCLVFYGGQPAPSRRPPRVPTIVITPPSEETHTSMESEEPGRDTSADNMSEVDSEKSETPQQTWVDEPMPEASQTSKRVREPEEGEVTNTPEKSKKKKDLDDFESILEHLKEIVAELESSQFNNIEEVLGLFPTVDVQRAVGSIIAMTGSTIPEENRPSHTKKYYKERKKVIRQNLCIRTFHEELEKEGFYPRYLGRVTLFGKAPLDTIT